MDADHLDLEIRSLPDPEGGLILDVMVEGRPLARATARADILDAMREFQGLSRESVEKMLTEALTQHVRGARERVKLGALARDSKRNLRFSAPFVYSEFDEITAGQVWYDVELSETGPDSAPTIVRNKMRTEVHRYLSGESSAADQVIDILK